MGWKYDDPSWVRRSQKKRDREEQKERERKAEVKQETGAKIVGSDRRSKGILP